MNKENIKLVILLVIIIIFLFVCCIKYFINSKGNVIPTPVPLTPVATTPTPLTPTPQTPVDITPIVPISAAPTTTEPTTIEPTSPTTIVPTMTSTINNAINSTLKIFRSKINKIELSIRGQTGKEEYTIESLTGDILVSKRIAPKLGEVISFDTNLPSIIINRFRSGEELFVLKIEKNKEVLPKSKTSSIIRGDLELFTSISDLNGRIQRQQDINQGKLKWPIKYQIDIGL